MPEQTIETCPDCGGRGLRDVIVDGVREGVKPCECKKQNLPHRLLTAAKIPKRYANCRLENYLTRKDAPHLEMALIKAAGYVEEYLLQPTPKGLLFQGSPGLGKTHLAVGVLHSLIEKKSVSCFFCDFAYELEKIRNSMNDEKTLILPALVYEASVLLLDDFGAQKWSAWVQDQMSGVISHRYNNGRATIITTNLTDKSSPERNALRIAYLKKLGVMDHEEQIDTFQLNRLAQVGIRVTSNREEPDTLEDQIGDRLRSRLYEMCEVIPMHGADYRRLQAERRKIQDLSK